MQSTVICYLKKRVEGIPRLGFVDVVLCDVIVGGVMMRGPRGTRSWLKGKEGDGRSTLLSLFVCCCWGS